MPETLMPSAFAMQSLCRSIFCDIKRLFPSDYPDQDVEYLISRLESEGTPFFLTVLPQLGKAVEKALILEEPLQVPMGWTLRKDSRLPLFLNYLFQKVFLEDGSPRSRFFSAESASAVLCIRQLTLLWSKVEFVVDDSVAQKAIEQFKARTTRDVVLCPHHVSLARELLERIFTSSHPQVEELRRFQKEPWGRQGPGAVADRSSPHQKWDFSHWPGLDKRLYAFSDTLGIPSKECLEQPDARVTHVPKDFRGPRIICIEPKENQFAQQGIMDILYRLLSTHPLTKDSISFRSTTQSERLCFSQNVGTIDLKDASDMISLEMGRLLLPRWVFKLVTRYRTRKISYQGISWAPNCLATMGNACCFPLETLLFWAIARSVVSSEELREKNVPPRPVRVYGDDIIVPIKAAGDVVAELERYGLTVNKEKTCVKTLVKESCGEWVCNGFSQRLVKVKSMNVSNLRAWLQYMAYSDHMCKLGLIATANTMLDFCTEFLPQRSIKERYNRRFQRKEFKLPAFASAGKHVQLEGAPGLYAWYVHNDTAPFLRGTSIKVKWRWTAENPYSWFPELSLAHSCELDHVNL